MKFEKNGKKFEIKFKNSEVCEIRNCEFYENGEFVYKTSLDNMSIKDYKNEEYPKMICFGEKINFLVSKEFADEFKIQIKSEKDFEKISKARKIIEKAEKQSRILTEKEQKEKLNTWKTINEGGYGYYPEFGISKEKYDCAKRILEESVV